MSERRAAPVFDALTETADARARYTTSPSYRLVCDAIRREELAGQYGPALLRNALLYYDAEAERARKVFLDHMDICVGSKTIPWPR